MAGIILYGWREQNEAAYGITAIRPGYTRKQLEFIFPVGHKWHKEDKRISIKAECMAECAPLPGEDTNGAWFFKFEHAKQYARDFWDERRATAEAALRTIRKATKPEPETE